MKHPRQNGFTIVSAIFILVVLAVLGAFMVTISTNQQIGSALDVQGSRAYQAARAGIEWGVYQVQSSAGYQFSYACPVTDTGSMCPNRRTCPSSPASFAFSTAPSLTGFVVTVTCSANADTVASGLGGFSGPTIYAITATACNQPISGWTATTTACPNTAPNNLYIERRLEVSF
ncbi:MAG: agglutinin biogenesis protein MshP [Proteobacteria bacterium]|nr:agglutinin biogenesis protein MshP [Pseudomonadota bacterium]